MIDGLRSVLPPSSNVTTYLAMQEREPAGTIASRGVWQLDNGTGKLQFCALDAMVKPTCIDMTP